MMPGSRKLRSQSMRDSEGVGVGQCKGELRSPAEFRLGPDASAVARDDALDDREADAGAGKLVLPMQALKDAKQLVVVAHVEARAVVAHAVNQVCAAALAGDLYPRRGLAAAVLQRVGQQVDPDLPEQRGVAVRGGQRADRQLRGCARAELVPDLTR